MPAAAKVAQEALARGVSLRQVALEKGYLTAEQLDADPGSHAMTEPGIPGQQLSSRRGLTPGALAQRLSVVTPVRP